MLRSGLSVLILAGVIAGACAQEKVPPSWKFAKDDSFRYENVSTVKQSMKLLDKDGKPEGKEIVQDITYTMVMSYKVLDVSADGTAVLESKVESMKFKNTIEAANKVLADPKLEGATFKITLNPKREVTALDGYEAFLKRMAGDDANVHKALQSIVTKESLMRSAREVFGFLPEKSEKTWTRDVLSPLGPLGDLNIKYSYKMEAPETVNGKPLEKITFDSTVLYSPPNAQNAAIQQSAFRVAKGDLKRTDQKKGTILFDAQVGRLASMDSDITLKGNMSLLVSGTKLDAEIEQNMKTKVTLVK
jgi:hypothetical protein